MKPPVMTVLPSLLNGLEGHDRVLCISAWSRPSIAGQAIDSLALVSHDGMIGKGTESRLPYHVRSRRSAVGKALCLILDSFSEFASLSRLHFFCGMIRLAKLVAEGFDEMDALPRQDNGCAFFERYGNQRSPPGMHAKAERRLPQVGCLHSGCAPSTISRTISLARFSFAAET